MEKVGVKAMITDVIDELLRVAKAQDCEFPANFKQSTIDNMLRPTESNSIMYQDYTSKRPMEVETYLGSPMKLAQAVGIQLPRIQTIYAILHNLNIVNQQRKDVQLTSPISGHPARLSSAPPPRPGMNGMMNGSGPSRGRGRVPSMNGVPPGMRRGPPPMNGGPPNGYGRPHTQNGYPQSRTQSRRGSIEGNDLEEFSHVVLYDDIPESGESSYGGDPSDFALRERELMLKQRELALREQEMRMRRGGPPGSRRGGTAPSLRNGHGGGFDDDDEDDFYDPADVVVPVIDPDNFDMMSVTSRRTRKAPSQSQIRNNPELGEGPPGRRGSSFMRPGNARNRSSARIISQAPTPRDSLMDDPMMGYSSNRYGTVDRQQLGLGSRTNSLTTTRLDEFQYGGSPNGLPGPLQRRASQSPGNANAYSPQVARGNGRPSPPNGYMGPGVNGRPSPPGGMRQPAPRHPQSQGHSVAPQQVEQYAGVSALNPPKGPVNIRSLTGSASASAGSGDSAHIDSEPSAHSSQSSLGPRPPIGVR
jgi:hypothetical protein